MVVSNRVRLTVVVSNRVHQYIRYPHCQVGSVGPEHSWLFQISNKWIGHIGWFSYRNTSCNRRSKNSRIIECGTPSKCNSQPNILCPSFVSALTKESIGSNGSILSNRPIWWKAKNRGKQDDAAIAKNRDLNLAMRNKMFVNRMTTCTIQCWELGVRNHSSPNGFYPDHKYGRQPTKKNNKKKTFKLLKACEGMIHHEVWPIEAHPVGYYRNCFVVFFCWQFPCQESTDNEGDNKISWWFSQDMSGHSFAIAL